MIRSSALYISLIVSLLILLICGAMLLIGYTYRMQERKQERLLRLRNNVESGTTILLLNSFKTDTAMRISLYGEEAKVLTDSVYLERQCWGLYDKGTVKSWRGGDTLSKSFLIGTPPADTLQVFYLADEDRPVSISGKSRITGTAYLPKSGIKAAYVESSGYADKTLVYGKILESKRTLLEREHPGWDQIRRWMSRLSLGKHEAHLMISSALKQQIVVADSSITVSGSASLEEVILIAPYIRIDADFKGSLQALATDSISTGSQLNLRYPSALVVLKNDTAGHQAKLKVGQDSRIEGQLIAYEKKQSSLMPVIEIGTGTLVKGEIWSKGYVSLAKKSRVEGSVSAIRLLSKIGGAIYENYLIDVTLDRPKLSRYYLSSKFINKERKKDQILCWMN